MLSGDQLYDLQKKEVPQTPAVSVFILMMMMMMMIMKKKKKKKKMMMMMMMMVTEHTSKTLFFKLTLTGLITHKSNHAITLF